MNSPPAGPGRWISSAVAIWLLVTSGGLFALVHYSSRPGPRGDVPAVWPADAGLARRPDRATLLMFIHPQCACTAASVSELARVMVRAGDRLGATALVVHPVSEPEDWSRTRTVAAAGEIPGVVVRTDRDGRIARRFGAETSGHVLVYDAGGKLSFSGGITPARGHEGHNAGRGAIEALLAGEPPACVATEVFGCELFEAVVRPEPAAVAR